MKPSYAQLPTILALLFLTALPTAALAQSANSLTDNTPHSCARPDNVQPANAHPTNRYPANDPAANVNPANVHADNVNQANIHADNVNPANIHATNVHTDNAFQAIINVANGYPANDHADNEHTANGHAANEHPANALGVRITGLWGVGAELSYQRFVGAKTRIEADLGMRIYDRNVNTGHIFTAAVVATSFQWRWPIGNKSGFYLGPALTFGRPIFGLGGGVQTGFDWYFTNGLQLSLDMRPTYNWFWYYGFDACLSLGLRYAF